MWALFRSSPKRVIRRILYPRIYSSLDKRQDAIKLITNKVFNYGTNKSIREEVSSSNYQNYFQILDQDIYLNSIQRRIFDAIIEFLDSKGIDISDLKERKTTILNSGLIVSGDSVETQNLNLCQD